MSKKVGFPVLSATLTGVLYILALLLGSLTILFSGVLADATLINGVFFFLAAFFAGWALFSFALHPALDANQRLVATIFTGLLVLLFFNAGFGFILGYA